MLYLVPFLFALAGTLFMTGVIWFMQLLEYPLFALVGSDEFPAYHARHNRGLPLLVFLPTFITLASVCALFWFRPRGVPTWPILLVLGLLLTTIVSTALWHAPLHQRLDRDGLALETIHTLVRANWLRTLTWTLTMLLMLYIVAVALDAA
jgi:hypothetical protein